MTTQRLFSRPRFYVGLPYDQGDWEVFKSHIEPTPHGFPLYAGVIGPFQTKRGAEFMVKHGRNNPHCQTVGDVERIAKKQQEDAKAAR